MNLILASVSSRRSILLGLMILWPKSRGIELVIDSTMVQNMKNATELAKRLSSIDYVDLTCKVPLRHG